MTRKKAFKKCEIIVQYASRNAPFFGKNPFFNTFGTYARTYVLLYKCRGALLQEND